MLALGVRLVCGVAAFGWLGVAAAARATWPALTVLQELSLVSGVVCLALALLTVPRRG